MFIKHCHSYPVGTWSHKDTSATSINSTVSTSSVDMVPSINTVSSAVVYVSPSMSTTPSSGIYIYYILCIAYNIIRS